MFTTITSKGQLTLPKKIRDILNLRPGNKVEFIMDRQGNVKMVPVKSTLKELKGMVPLPKKTISLEEMQMVIEERTGNK